jgi:hypothetical protein
MLSNKSPQHELLHHNLIILSKSVADLEIKIRLSTL